MSAAPAHIDVTDASFGRDVVERSKQVPVVVDFWAEWCAPCRALGPVLERLAAEADGRWILAKVDVDSNPEVARSFGIRSIPAVKAFADGREVSEFVGALPEAQVRRWLDGLGSSPAGGEVGAGARAEAAGDLAAAAEAYRAALGHDPSHPTARLRLARVELALRARDHDEDELRRRIVHDGRDLDAIVALADLEAVRGDVDAAARRLVDAVAATAGDARDRARTHLLGLLDTLEPDDPRAVKARRALSLVLF